MRAALWRAVDGEGVLSCAGRRLGLKEENGALLLGFGQGGDIVTVGGQVATCRGGRQVSGASWRVNYDSLSTSLAGDKITSGVSCPKRVGYSHSFQQANSCIYMG